VCNTCSTVVMCLSRAGNEELDQMLRVMLGTAMFVGGGVGCILDNTVPGTSLPVNQQVSFRPVV